jgi:glycosyltransferase involved in cell wall biosynthesis
MSARKITAIIPTLNEQACLAEAIGSVSFADEVLVVDSFSSDQTVPIARKMNARVIQREFDDFSSQKNFALEKASHDWIVQIDADERVSKELEQEILRTVEHDGNEVAYYVFRNFFFKDKRIRHGGWQTDKSIRLFNRKHCRYDGKLVHETIETRCPVGFLKNRLDHFSYKDKTQYASKLDTYAKMQAEELFRKGKKMHILFIAVKPPFRFLVHYFVRMGFLDGAAGFRLAYEHARGVFMRYLYLKRRFDAPESE